VKWGLIALNDMSRDILLSDELKALEEKLLCSNFRKDKKNVSNLLAEEFTEFGASGTVYNKSSTLISLESEETRPSPVIKDFDLSRLNDNYALVTYRLYSSEDPNSLTQVSLRSSIWRQKGSSWKMLFHQGTSIK